MSNPNEYPGQGSGPDFQPGGQGGYPPAGQYQQYGQGYGQQLHDPNAQYGYGEEPPKGGGAGKWVAIALAAVLVIGGALGAFWWFGGDEEPVAEPSVSASAEEPSEEPSDEPTSEEPSEEPTSEAPSEEPTSAEPSEEPTPEAPSEEPASEDPTEDSTPEDGMVSVPEQVGEWKFFSSESGASYHHQESRTTVLLDLEQDAQVEVLKKDLSDVVEFDGGVCGNTSTGNAVRCYLVNSTSPEGEHISLFSGGNDRASVEEIVPLAEAIAQS